MIKMTHMAHMKANMKARTKIMRKILLPALIFSSIAVLSVGFPAMALTQKEFYDVCLKGDAGELAEALQDGGISPTQADANGTTPLMFAAQARGKAADAAKIRMLLNAGNKVNSQNKDSMKPLLYAAQSSDNPEVILTLLQAGSDIEERSSRGFTPLCFAAARNPSPEIVDVLFDLGADINATDNASSTPIMLAVRAGTSYAVVDALLKNGADPSLKNSSKKTAAEQISAKSYTEEQIAEMNTRFAQKPAVAAASAQRFAAACRFGVTSRIKLFLDARTSPNEPYEGKTPLMWAASYNTDPAVVSLLIRYGADENALDSDGRTPLIHAAMSNNNPAIINSLLNAGARADAIDSDGMSALDHAKENPACRADDLQLLESIEASITEAEDRGMRIEAERQRIAQGTLLNSTQLTKLYQQLASDQTQITQLTTANSQLQNELTLAKNSLQSTQKQFNVEHERNLELEDQLRRVNESFASLQSVHANDMDAAQNNIKLLTSLWKGEMEKNLALTEKSSLETHQNKEEVDGLRLELQKLTDELKQANEALQTAENRFADEKNSLQAAQLRALELQESTFQSEKDALNAKLQEYEEQMRQAERQQSVTAAQHRQKIIDLRAMQDHALNDATAKHEQEIARLKAENQKQIDDLTARVTRQHSDEINALNLAWEEKQSSALLAQQGRFMIELSEQDKQARAKFEEELALSEKNYKDEAAAERERAESELSELKKNFDVSLIALNDMLKKTHDENARLQQEMSAAKDIAEKNNAALTKEIESLKANAETELKKGIAAREEELRLAFSLEKANLEMEHRRELLDLTAELESITAEEKDKIRDEHEKEMNEKVSALENELQRVRTQALEDVRNARIAAAEPAALSPLSRALHNNAVQECDDARELYETAYAASLKQSEQRYNKLLKEQQIKQKSEYDAALERLNARSSQEKEMQAMRLAQEYEAERADSDKKHAAEIVALKQEHETQLDLRIQELTERHDAEIRQLRADSARSEAAIIDGLRKEYDAKLAALAKENRPDPRFIKALTRKAALQPTVEQ